VFLFFFFLSNSTNQKLFLASPSSSQGGGDGSGAFCMGVYEGDGTVVEMDPFTGGFTLDLGADWIAATVSIQYTCAPGLLTMQGSSSADGGLGWGPYVYTS